MEPKRLQPKKLRKQTLRHQKKLRWLRKPARPQKWEERQPHLVHLSHVHLTQPQPYVTWSWKKLLGSPSMTEMKMNFSPQQRKGKYERPNQPQMVLCVESGLRWRDGEGAGKKYWLSSVPVFLARGPLTFRSSSIWWISACNSRCKHAKFVLDQLVPVSSVPENNCHYYMGWYTGWDLFAKPWYDLFRPFHCIWAGLCLLLYLLSRARLRCNSVRFGLTEGGVQPTVLCRNGRRKTGAVQTQALPEEIRDSPGQCWMHVLSGFRQTWARLVVRFATPWRQDFWEKGRLQKYKNVGGRLQKYQNLFGLGSGPGKRLWSGTSGSAWMWPASGCRCDSLALDSGHLGGPCLGPGRHDGTRLGDTYSEALRSLAAVGTLGLDRHGWRADAQASCMKVVTRKLDERRKRKSGQCRTDECKFQGGSRDRSVKVFPSLRKHRRSSFFRRCFFLIVLVCVYFQALGDLMQLRLMASTFFHSGCCNVPES